MLAHFRRSFALAALLLSVAFLAPPGRAQVAVPQPFSASIECAAPTRPGVQVNDLLAQAWWDGGGFNEAKEKPQVVSRYEVEVYLATDGFADPSKRKLLKKPVDNRVDLQPIENDKAYVARVRSVDRSGKLSEWVPFPAPFTPNRARRDRLAAEFNAFFDDANSPTLAGKDLDPEKWELGYNVPSEPTLTDAFANDQNHYHHGNAPWKYFDRSANVARPNVRMWHRWRNEAGEENTAYIEMDVTKGYRHILYFDFLPQPQDVYPWLQIFNPNASRISRGIRVTMGGEGIEVFEARQAGVEPVSVAKINMRFMTPPHRQSTNVRQPWRFVLKRTGAKTGSLTIFVGEHENGTPIQRLVAPLANLDWEASWLHINNFGYNTPKEGNRRRSVFHWDMVGIKGPNPVNVFRAYYQKIRGAQEIANLPAITSSLTKPLTYEIPVPDAPNIANLVKAVLFVSMDFEGNKASEYKPNPAAKILFNGTKLSFNPPDQEQRTTLITVPNALIQPANTIQVFADKAYVYNLRLRLEVPRTKATYKSPCLIFQNCLTHVIGPAGPGAVISAITANGKTYGGGATDSGQLSPFTVGPPVSGTVVIEGRVDQIGPVIETGNPAPVDLIELLIDGQVASTISIPVGIGEGKYRFNVDTTKLSNGKHLFFFRAKGQNGQGSWADYFEKHAEQNQREGFETALTVAN
jgi:hypothetical protein